MLRFCSGSDCWGVKVLYGEEASQDKDGPLEVEKCMSCDLDCPLSVGVGAGDTSLMSKDTLLESFEHHNAWIDAKARPLYVVTPKRHVRRLAELRYLYPFFFLFPLSLLETPRKQA
jgi:hypothetical protein